MRSPFLGQLDPNESPDAPAGLAQRRAEYVKDYLVTQFTLNPEHLGALGKENHEIRRLLTRPLESTHSWHIFVVNLGQHRNRQDE